MQSKVVDTLCVECMPDVKWDIDVIVHMLKYRKGHKYCEKCTKYLSKLNIDYDNILKVDTLDLAKQCFLTMSLFYINKLRDIIVVFEDKEYWITLNPSHTLEDIFIYLQTKASFDISNVKLLLNNKVVTNADVIENYDKLLLKIY